MAINQIRNAGDCQRWLASHPIGADNALLPVAELANLLVRVADGDFSPTVGFRILELLRQRIVANAQPLFSQARRAPAPHFNRFSAQLRKLDQCLEALTCSYRALHPAMEFAPRPRLSFIPGASNSLKNTMPLLRALEIQSNRICGRLLCRVVVDDDLWVDLASLGRQVRETTFLDEIFEASAASGVKITARALITYPLLMHVAGYSERTPAQGQWVEFLARTNADKTGFRIEPAGKASENPYGPSMILGRQYQVRLDTHRLLSGLARTKDEITADKARMNAVQDRNCSLSVSEISALNDDLRIRWSAAWRWPNMQLVNYPKTRIAFGLPTGISTTTKAYEYARYEQQHTVATIDREVAAPTQAFTSQAESACVTGIDQERVVFERYANKPAPAINTLVALDMIPNPAFGTSGLRLGRVRRVEHILNGTDGQTGQRVAVQTLRGDPLAVRLCGSQPGEAYFLGSEYGSRREASVFISPDTIRSGCRVRFELPAGDISVEVGHLIERGPGYDRYQVTACGASTI
ncbi:MAG: hypothetical protein WBD34_17760 [Burkholderiaceae bacterium]